MALTKHKSYFLFWLFSTLVKEALLAVAALVVLPRFEIAVPLWALAAVMVAFGTYSYVNFRIDRKILAKKPEVGIENMVGATCVAATPLTPHGYVLIDGERWEATSMSGNMAAKTQAVVTEVNGFTLSVAIRPGVPSLPTGTKGHPSADH